MSWETIRPVLVKLSALQPKPVRDGPDPHVIGPRRSPFHIGLEPWASHIAAALHKRFGPEVILSVGYFGYPSRLAVDSWGRPRPGGLASRPAAEERALMVDPAALTFELAGELVMASGHEADAPLLVANHSARPIEIHRLRAVIVDPANGVTVGDAMPPGARSTAVTHARDVLAIAPGGISTFALRVGTASRDPALGYAVPPGAWAVRVFLERSGQVVRAPLLPITIT
jgi:hypothetical protein